MSRLKDSPTCSWITTNRDCNLRCKWCYAQEAISSNEIMSIENAEKAIEIISSFGIKSTALIGGEPTCHRDLGKIVTMCTSRGIKPSLITNGIKLADESYLQSLKDAGLKSINISLKSNSNEGYLRDTGKSCFDTVLKAIHNCSDYGIKHTVSMVMTESNIDDIPQMVRIAKNEGARKFYLSFCNPYSASNTFKTKINEPLDMIQRFQKIYYELESLKVNFSIHQNMPLCIWPEEMIKEMEKSGRFKSICQLQKKAGLIFTPNLSVIPCNSMYNYPIAKYGADYSDYWTLRDYLKSDYVKAIYKQLLRAPSMKCIDCKRFDKCGGGCVMFWTKYELDRLLLDV